MAMTRTAVQPGEGLSQDPTLIADTGDSTDFQVVINPIEQLEKLQNDFRLGKEYKVEPDGESSPTPDRLIDTENGKYTLISGKLSCRVSCDIDPPRNPKGSDADYAKNLWERTNIIIEKMQDLQLNPRELTTYLFRRIYNITTTQEFQNIPINDSGKPSLDIKTLVQEKLGIEYQTFKEILIDTIDETKPPYELSSKLNVSVAPLYALNLLKTKPENVTLTEYVNSLLKNPQTNKYLYNPEIVETVFEAVKQGVSLILDQENKLSLNQANLELVRANYREIAEFLFDYSNISTAQPRRSKQSVLSNGLVLGVRVPPEMIPYFMEFAAKYVDPENVKQIVREGQVIEPAQFDNFLRNFESWVQKQDLSTISEQELNRLAMEIDKKAQALQKSPVKTWNKANAPLRMGGFQVKDEIESERNKLGAKMPKTYIKGGLAGFNMTHITEPRK